MGEAIAAVVAFILPRFFGKGPRAGAPARSPRVSSPPDSPIGYVPRPEQENEVADKLVAGECVCITGDPGIGKSCLAMEVVHRQDTRERFSDGVWWLDAAGMDVTAMCEAVGSALGTGEVAGAKSDEEKLRALRTAIGARRVLLVLDNCEDPEAARRFAEEGHRATLVTSQHRPTGPHTVPLDRLSDDQCLDILHRSSPRPLEADEEPMAREIVGVLHGHPFAAALAGGQLEDASAHEVLKDLKRSPWPVLTGKGRRRWALKATLDGAYKRLPRDDRPLFAALGVFGGPSFDLAAMQAVEPSADVVRMEGLARRSLLRRESGRYALHPLVRRYAADRLGRRREPYRMMAAHYLVLAEALGKDPATFNQLEAEVGNALAAMDWCLQARQWETAARLAVGLSYYLGLRGLWGERRERLKAGREAAQRTRDRWLRCACSHNLAWAAQDQGDYEEAQRLYDESLRVEEELGDRAGIAITKHQLGTLAQKQGDREEARRLYEESLRIEEEMSNRAGIARTKHQLGILAHDHGDYREARRLYKESLTLEEELRNRLGIAQSKHQLGTLAQDQGDREEARRLYEESLSIKEEMGDRVGMAKTKHQLGMLGQRQGDYEGARRLYEESLTIKEEVGNPLEIALTKHQLGMLAQEQGDREEARRLYEQSLAIKEELGNRAGIASTKHNLGALAQEQGDREEARRLYEESLTIKEELGDRPGIAKTKHHLGALAQAQGDREEARRLYEESLTIEEELGDRPGIASAKHQLGRLAEEEGDAAAARHLYKDALAIFESLGSPDAEIARRNLERLESEQQGGEQ